MIKYGITWQISDRFGWGVYGMNLAIQLLLKGRQPELLTDSANHVLPNDIFRSSMLGPLQNRPLPDDPLICMYSLFNKLEWDPGPFYDDVTASKKVGMIFLEYPEINSKHLQAHRAREFDVVITGSDWNNQVLNSYGIHNVRIHQGIDPAIFHPAPRLGYFQDRFVIYAGGRLTYRKGQDLVVEAFKRFRKKRSDALLMISWSNSWPATTAGLGRAGYVTQPHLSNDMADQPMQILLWLKENGLSERDVIVLPELPNSAMAGVMREANVALALSRAEGGTNLVAMECMACGIPVVMACNTGQMDFADPKDCYPVSSNGHGSYPGWSEVDPDEVVETLEEIYTDYDRAVDVAINGADKIRKYSWSNQVERLVQCVEEL
jgi:glycosyltransferase involved in cell wall biosynthesis